MFKSFLSSIVGDDSPAPSPAPKPAETSRPPSRPPSQPPSGRSSPMSESGSSFFGTLGRRGSSSSIHSMTSQPEEPDLSHLSAQERQQIEAVIARAREMQQEGDQRIRDIEKDFGTPATEPEKPALMTTKTSEKQAVPTTKTPVSSSSKQSAIQSGAKPTQSSTVSQPKQTHERGQAKQASKTPMPTPTFAKGQVQRDAKGAYPLQETELDPYALLSKTSAPIFGATSPSTTIGAGGKSSAQRLQSSGGPNQFSGDMTHSRSSSAANSSKTVPEPIYLTAPQRKIDPSFSSNSDNMQKVSPNSGRIQTGTKNENITSKPTPTQSVIASQGPSSNQSFQMHPESSANVSQTDTKSPLIHAAQSTMKSGQNVPSFGALDTAHSESQIKSKQHTAGSGTKQMPITPQGHTTKSPKHQDPKADILKGSSNLQSHVSINPMSSTQSNNTHSNNTTAHTNLTSQNKTQKGPGPPKETEQFGTQHIEKTGHSLAADTARLGSKWVCAECNTRRLDGDPCQPCHVCQAYVCRFCAAHVHKGLMKQEWWCLKCMKQKHAPPQPGASPARTHSSTHGTSSTHSTPRTYGTQDTHSSQYAPPTTTYTQASSGSQESPWQSKDQHQIKPAKDKEYGNREQGQTYPYSFRQQEDQQQKVHADKRKDPVIDSRKSPQKGFEDDRSKDKVKDFNVKQTFPVPKVDSRSQRDCGLGRTSPDDFDSGRYSGKDDFDSGRYSGKDDFDSGRYSGKQDGDQGHRGHDQTITRGHKQSMKLPPPPPPPTVQQRKQEKESDQKQVDIIATSAKHQHQKADQSDKMRTQSDSLTSSNVIDSKRTATSPGAYQPHKPTRESGVGEDSEEQKLSHSPQSNRYYADNEDKFDSDQGRSSRPSNLALSPSKDATEQSDDDYVSLTPQRKDKHAPYHRSMQKQPSIQDEETTEEKGTKTVQDKNGGDINTKKESDCSDSSKSTRTVGEGAEAPVTGGKKPKPSPLDRVSASKSFDNGSDSTKTGHAQSSAPRRQSPSRVSPRSPPRSPSWKRYRDSPPRSPGSLHMMSPTKSPASTERFPASYSESPRGERQGTYGSENEFVFPDKHLHGGSANIHLPMDLEMPEHHESDRPPPKPARLSGGAANNGRGSSNIGGTTMVKSSNLSGSMDANTTMDLASYAATVASSTAHLTSMSVSPTNQSQAAAKNGNVSEIDRQTYRQGHQQLDQPSPESPSYYDDEDEELEDMDLEGLSDPSTKSIDYGNTRQKIKPPATDWSPVTDLSPILDVSPSLEKIEQEKMIAEQESFADHSERTHDEMMDSGLYSNSSYDYEHPPPPRPVLPAHSGNQQQQQYAHQYGPTNRSSQALGHDESRFYYGGEEGRGNEEGRIEAKNSTYKSATSKNTTMSPSHAHTSYSPKSSSFITETQEGVTRNGSNFEKTGVRDMSSPTKSHPQDTTHSSTASNRDRSDWSPSHQYSNVSQNRLSAKEGAGTRNEQERLGSKQQQQQGNYPSPSEEGDMYEYGAEENRNQGNTRGHTAHGINRRGVATGLKGESVPSGIGADKEDRDRKSNQSSKVGSSPTDDSSHTRTRKYDDSYELTTVSDNSHTYQRHQHHTKDESIFEGDPEIDIDDDLPLQKRNINIDNSKLLEGDHVTPLDYEQEESEDTPFERQGGLVRSKVRFFSQSSQSDEHDLGKSTSAPLHSFSQDDINNANTAPNSVTSYTTQSPERHAFKPTHTSSQQSLKDKSESVKFRETSTFLPEADTGSTRTSKSSGKGGKVITRSQSLDSPTRFRNKDGEKKNKRRLPPVPSMEDIRPGSASPSSLTSARRPMTSTLTSSSSSPHAFTRTSPPTSVVTSSLVTSSSANMTSSPNMTVSTSLSSLRQDKELLRQRLKQKEAELKAATNGGSVTSLNGHRSPNGKTNGKPQPSVMSSVNNGITTAGNDGLQTSPSKKAKPKPPQTLPKPTLKTQQQTQAVVNVPPKPAIKPKPKKVETVDVYGIKVPVDVRSMKKRIKEEIQIVTATRRLKIDEMEEVRIMERELADREKKRKFSLEIQARNKAKQRVLEEKERERLRKLEEEIKKQRDQEKLIEKERMQAEEQALAQRLSAEDRLLAQKFGADTRLLSQVPSSSLAASLSCVTSTVPTVSSLPVTSSTSLTSSPRMNKTRHRRQNSDPILSAFSPIEERRDFESEEASYRLGMEARRLGSTLSMTYSPQPTRRGLRAAGLASDISSQYAERMATGYPLRPSGRSKSSEVLNLVDKDERLNVYQDIMNLNQPLGRTHKSKSQYSGMDEMNGKEEKRYLLQLEIEKRRQALEENARLRMEIQKLTEAANIGAYEFALAKSKYQEHMAGGVNVGAANTNFDEVARSIPNQLVYESLVRTAPSHASVSYMPSQGVPSQPHAMDSRIIRPLEHLPPQHGMLASQQMLPQQYMDSVDSKKHITSARSFPQNNFSSTEYLSHRGDMRPMPAPALYENIAARSIPSQSLYDGSCIARSAPVGYPYDSVPSHRTMPSNAYDRNELYYRHMHPPPPPQPPPTSQYYPHLGDRAGMDILDSVARDMRNLSDQVGGLYQSAQPITDAKSAALSSYNPRRAELDYYGMSGVGLDAQSEASIATDTTAASVKDNTPSMPILDDVTMRSRTKLRKIGSRPLSDDFGEYTTSDPLMLRVESDNSVAESDDHVMEGGITIKERKDHKKIDTDSSKPGQYNFQTKCILLTKDPKERSVQGRKQGNGIGMKIVGGKIIPGTNEVGAYVSAIYPGGVADQLHGELQEGDQVLEWNGISLTGKTYEEVQNVISQPNGEIELVVRPVAHITQKDPTMSTLSAHSSYDNLESTTSDYEDFDGRILDARIAAQNRAKQQQQQQHAAGQKPAHNDSSSSGSPFKLMPQHSSSKTELVNSLAASTANNVNSSPSRHANQSNNSRSEGQHNHTPAINTTTSLSNALPRGGGGGRVGGRLTEHHMSPGASPSSSQHDMYLSPSASMSGSSHSDQHIELPALGADPENWNRDPHDWGELQLQLSYDDYDGTLNIHVMQAKGLKPKDRNGMSDPFVKCYLLPGRIGENKRRTKIIQKSLDPEWHQTLVFMKISKDELKSKTLEVTIWDYDRFKPNDFLGELFLDLGDPFILDNKPHWYKLHEHDAHMACKLSKVVPYSPANNSTRNPLAKLDGHSRPIDDPDPPGTESPQFAMKPVVPHKDIRTLQPEHSGAKYSPGLGRRKDVIKQDRLNKRTSDGFSFT